MSCVGGACRASGHSSKQARDELGVLLITSCGLVGSDALLNFAFSPSLDSGTRTQLMFAILIKVEKCNKFGAGSRKERCQLGQEFTDYDSFLST